MFVKIYRYRVLKGDFAKSERINKEADKVYDEYYGIDRKEPITLFNKKDGVVQVLILDFYSSKKAYYSLIDKVNRDVRIDKLYNNFISLIIDKKVESEEFEKL